MVAALAQYLTGIDQYSYIVIMGRKGLNCYAIPMVSLYAKKMAGASSDSRETAIRADAERICNLIYIHRIIIFK